MMTSARRFFTLGSLVVFLFLVLYAVLTFITPQTATSKEQFNISDATLFWIRLPIILVYGVVWVSAIYCVRVLKLLSQKNTEFSSFARLFSWGFLLLLIGMITTTILGSVRNLVIHSSLEAIPFLTIVTNYAYIFFPLAAYIFMWRGVTRWTSQSASTMFMTKTLTYLIRAGAVTLLIALMYFPLVFTNANRQIALNPDTPATYYLSDPLIVLTLLLPALIAWTLGIAVAFRTNEKLLSRDMSSTGTFTNGILVVIFSSMFLQMLISLGTERLFALGLGSILLLVYVLILLQAAGFIFTARGVWALENQVR